MSSNEHQMSEYNLSSKSSVQESPPIDSAMQPESPEDERLWQFMSGIKEDVKANIGFYANDWSKPKKISLILNASIFAYSIQLIPALIFSELIDRKTAGNMATAEVFLATAIMGIIYAVLSGQPLVILGVTGPVAILIGTAYDLALQQNADFFPFFFWICLWAGLLHIITAMTGLVGLVWQVTTFTTQIFEFFVACDFIYVSTRDLIEPIALLNGEHRADRSQQYATAFIGAATFYIAWILTYAESWVFFNKPTRKFLSNYNSLIALIVGTALSYLPGVDLSQDGQVGLDRVNIRFSPWDGKPTADRSWIVDPMQGISGTQIAFAFIPGFMFYLLFIIDHNVGSILTQSAKYNLTKPPAFHWDFFILGFTFIPSAFLGIPPGNGLIPQSPMHVRALCTRTVVTDENGQRRETYTNCEEQRWSPMVQSCLFLLSLAAFQAIRLIPRGCLFGLFFYLGLNMMNGNEIWQRILLNIISEKHRPPIPVVKYVPWRVTQLWTFIQVCLAGVVFVVATFTPIGTFSSWMFCPSTDS